MKINLKATKTVVSIALSAVGIGGVMLLWSRERNRTHDAIVKNRSAVDWDILKKSTELAAKVDTLKQEEAVKDVDVAISVNDVEAAVGSVSQRAKGVLSDIKEAGEYISESRLKEAFSGVQDTEEPIKKLIGKARKDAVEEARTAEDWQLISDAEKAKGAAMLIFDRERRLLPNLKTAIMCFASRHRKWPAWCIELLLIAPVIPFCLLIVDYVSMIREAVKAGHSACSTR